MKSIFAIFPIVLICLLSLSRAEDGVMQTGDVATLSVVQPYTPRLIDDKLSIRIELASITTATVYVDSVRAEFPEALTNTRTGAQIESGFFHKVEADNKLSLGETFRHSFELPRESFNWLRPF